MQAKDIADKVKLAKEASAHMEELLKKLPTLQSQRLIAEAFWDLTLTH